MVLGVVVEIQRPTVVGKERIDTREESNSRNDERIHGIEEGAHEVSHRALQDRLKRMNGVLPESTRLNKLLS